MNSLERFRAAYSFSPLDRLPIFTFGGWEETYQRWEQEGLPSNWRETNFFGEDKLGVTSVHLGTAAFSPFFPRFERQVLSEDETHIIFRDEHGRVLRQKRDEINISIAQYLEFPVKSRSDWEQIKWRMDPSVEVRYENLAETARKHGGKNGQRDYPVLQIISGTFRILWLLMGDPNLYYVFHDDPQLVHDIMRTWLEMNTRAIDRVMQHIDFNVLAIFEDFAGNTGMLISPKTFREFMMPYYKELIQHVRRYPSLFGIYVDSDGDVSQSIPLLLECGVQGVCPFEVQAGMDVVALRQQYGDRLVIRGGIDKRVLPKGKAAIDRELDRVLPTFVKTGGYFICLDHQAPPDVSLENYLYFLEKARSYK